MAQFSFDPAAGPAPLTVQFTGQSTGIIDDFLWQFGDAQESPSTSPQHVYSEAGSYTVTLTVTGPGGVDAMTVVDAIVVGEALPGFIRADANQDQALDIADAVFILTYLFGGGSDGGCSSAIDANDDGANNVADAVTVLDHLFSAGSPILPPFPGCGVDPTPDALECSNPACP
jgi:PKD repeat protein